MKLHSDLTVNGKRYQKGDVVPWQMVYPFFALHMLAFGLSGFFMAYADNGPPLSFVYLHGGFACLVYVIFYLTIFGPDRVKWMFINAGLGLFGIYAQIDWILGWFGKNAGDYSIARHAIPFFYYVLYTFLLYHFVLTVCGAGRSERRRRVVEWGYVVVSTLAYAAIWYFDRR